MTMHTYHSISDLRQALDEQRSEGHRIAVVPTMGNLHAGHIALVEKALELADFVVTTIFVNPMQFGANEDLDNYPRTLEADAAQLQDIGCHALFAPTNREVYPYGLDSHTQVTVPTLSALHCGASRPGHFDGVTTVVCKLFNIVMPDIAVFGLKDYQQFQLVRKMISDLCMPVELVGVETRRESSGLALSSRNGYLSDTQRSTATSIHRCLQHCREAILQGNHDYRTLESDAVQKLHQAGLRTDYFSICHARTLQPAMPGDRELVILAAAWMDQTRLIDNIRITLQDDENNTGDAHVH